MQEMANVSRKSIAFCRFVIAILFWLVGLTRIKWLLFIPLFIMLLSAILGVKNAPLIKIGDLLFKKKNMETVSVQSIRFAHYFGSIMTIITLLFFYVFKLDIVGYVLTWLLIVLQTIAAFGYCSAQKLFECLILGNNCCNLGKKLRGGKCNVR